MRRARATHCHTSQTHFTLHRLHRATHCHIKPTRAGPQPHTATHCHTPHSTLHRLHTLQTPQSHTLPHCHIKATRAGPQPHTATLHTTHYTDSHCTDSHNTLQTPQSHTLPHCQTLPHKNHTLPHCHIKTTCAGLEPHGCTSIQPYKQGEPMQACVSCRVGQNHIYLVIIRFTWHGNHQTYGL